MQLGVTCACVFLASHKSSSRAVKYAALVASLNIFIAFFGARAFSSFAQSQQFLCTASLYPRIYHDLTQCEHGHTLPETDAGCGMLRGAENLRLFFRSLSCLKIPAAAWAVLVGMVAELLAALACIQQARQADGGEA